MFAVIFIEIAVFQRCVERQQNPPRDFIKRTLSPYFRNSPLLHITIRLHLTWRLLKFMQWLARKQYLYWNVPCWGHQLWDINCCMRVCVSVCPPTYRYIAPRMIQRIILKFCGYVGCDDATNVSNFGYEPITFSSFMLNIRMHTMQIKYVNSSRIQHT